MKKHLIPTLTIILALFIPTLSFGTVGGSETIYNFKYNPTDESIYYTQIDGGGRGCPPTLHKMSLKTGQKDVVLSCDDAEELRGSDWDNKYLVDEKINEMTIGLKDLKQIDLKGNGISIDVDLHKEVNEYGGVSKRIFNANIFQNNKLIDKEEITACDINEPFIFDGYKIPGFEKKIMLLMSAKKDCFEGGYVSDSMYIVDGVSNIKDDAYISSLKGLSPIQPSAYTLIVFEKDEIDTKTEDENTCKAEEGKECEDNNFMILISFLTFITGVIFGFVLGKTRRSNIEIS